MLKSQVLLQVQIANYRCVRVSVLGLAVLETTVGLGLVQV